MFSGDLRAFWRPAPRCDFGLRRYRVPEGFRSKHSVCAMPFTLVFLPRPLMRFAGKR